MAEVGGDEAVCEPGHSAKVEAALKMVRETVRWRAVYEAAAPPCLE